MLKEKDLLKIIEDRYEARSDFSEHAGVSYLTLGVVVDTDDPLQNGRLRVFCASLGDDPKKLHHLPWAIYISPYGGTVNNSSFTRGAGKGTATSSGSVSYGFWGIPEQGSKVLVGCVDGDERRRFWLGSAPEHQETHTLFHGRYKWDSEGGTPDGPLTSLDKPLNPLYENMQKAFRDKNSREWKTRGAEYQVTAINKSLGQPPNSEKPTYIDEQFEHITKAEEDSWVQKIVGSHGYDWTGFKNLGSHLSSRVFGFSTPGGHAISLDDRAFNNRTRIRSATGHQILLDDTNERIYISTNEGNSFIEMDSSGNIDMFSDRRISVNSKKDINFSTDETFRVKAKKGIHMYSGDTRDQEPLPGEELPDGQIRFHSTHDLHMFIEKSLRQIILENKKTEVKENQYLTVGGDLFNQIQNNYNTIVNDGDYSLTVIGNIYNQASIDVSSFAGNNQFAQAAMNSELMSYQGYCDIGSQQEMSIRSYKGDVGIDADEGAYKMTSNEKANSITMDENGIINYSNSAINTFSATGVNTAISSSFSREEGGLEDGGSPATGCLNIQGVNIEFTDSGVSFDVLDDISYKSSTMETSINTINTSLELIEAKVNTGFHSIWTTFASEINGLDSFPLSFSVPVLFDFPAISFDFQIPAINLPDFDFPDFCIDFNNLLNVDNFNFYPDQAFIDINIDLGGWSKSSFENYRDKFKDNFDTMIFNMSPDNVKNQLEQEIEFIKIRFEIIKDTLHDLVDINITSNAQLLQQYNVTLTELLEGFDEYNNQADINNFERIDGIYAKTYAHKRNIGPISDLAQSDPNIDNEDYSDIQDFVDEWDGYTDEIIALYESI